MFSIRKTLLPSAIEVDGRSYSIKTDFHWWLQFHYLIKSESIKSFTDIDFLYSGRKPNDRIKGYEELLKFLNPEKKIPRAINTEPSNVIVYDYELDAGLIYSAFMEQYGIDLFESNMHWWKFLELFNGLHNTRFNEITSIRCFKKDDKQSYEDSMLELQRMWSIETEESEEKIKRDLEKFNQIFFG